LSLEQRKYDDTVAASVRSSYLLHNSCRFELHGEWSDALWSRL